MIGFPFKERNRLGIRLMQKENAVPQTQYLYGKSDESCRTGLEYDRTYRLITDRREHYLVSL